MEFLPCSGLPRRAPIAADNGLMGQELLTADDCFRLKRQVSDWAERIAVFRPTEGRDRWSLAEGRIPDELLEELASYLARLEPAAVDAAMKIAAAPFGIMLISRFAREARMHASESDTWSALGNLLPKATRTLFPNGSPAPSLYDTLERGFERYKLRTSGARGAGEQYFVVSLRLQIGFTEHGIRSSWRSWFCVSQVPEAAEMLSRECHSFRVFWGAVRDAARGKLSAKQLVERLQDSPWISPDFMEELASIVTETPPEQLHLRPWKFVWLQNSSPRIEVDLPALFPGHLSPGIVAVDGERSGKLVEQPGARVALVDGSTSLSTPVRGPECLVELPGTEMPERIAIWDASGDVSKVEGAGGQRFYASRALVTPREDSFERFHRLRGWCLWQLIPGLVPFRDADGGVVYEVGAPPPRIETNVRVSQDFKPLGETFRLKVVTASGTAERIRMANQTAPVDRDFAWLKATPEIAARPYVPRVRIRVNGVAHEAAGQRTRLRAYGIAEALADQDTVIESGEKLSRSRLASLVVVTPEPDWLLCEGPAAVARPKEGSVPFPSNRMHWTGEKVTLRQRLLESELTSG